MESLSSEALSQVKQAGQQLADKGVTHSQSQGTPSPAATPAIKYAGNEAPQREITLPSRSR
jgi:hypothetical protein